MRHPEVEHTSLFRTGHRASYYDVYHKTHTRLEYHLQTNFKDCSTNIMGARGGAVGWGTALQTGRSRVRFPIVSLEFFIDLILSVALWPWGGLSL
jgi:hypothetical protein